jgi:cytidine deaminase
MKPVPENRLKPRDRALIAAAREIIRRRFCRDKHHVGAALRTKSGRVFTGVHLDTYVGRVAICAEAVALGAAATAGDSDIEAIVAVHHTGQVVSPCGMCREMVADFAPEARVIVPVDGKCAVLPVLDLLPHKYQKGNPQPSPRPAGAAGAPARRRTGAGARGSPAGAGRDRRSATRNRKP